MGLTQAQHLVFGQLCRLVALAVAASALLLAIRHLQLIAAPAWMDALLALVAIPVYHVGRAYWQYWQNARKAARLGATLPPRWDGKLPGNWDVLQLVDQAYFKGYLSDHFYEKFDELGSTYNFYALWDNNYFTQDAAVIKSILANDFNNWIKGDRFDSFMHSVLGTGVFNADGEMWKFHRSMTRPFFARERIADFETFDRHAEKTIKNMKERLRTGYAVDFADLIGRFTLDSATEFLFGVCVHSLHGVLPYPHTASPYLHDNRPQSPADGFAEAFRAAQDAIAHRASVTWLWPWFEPFDDPTKKPMQVVDRYLKPIIEKALQMGGQAKKEGSFQDEEISENETLLDHLARFTTDPVVLHDEILNIMIAGRDTTAGTLTIAIYFLSQHPDVLRRLRQEILNVVGPTSRPTYDNVKKMKYLRAVLNETLRLYPVVPWNMRYAVEDAVLPNPDPTGKPWFIPGGASVTYSLHCMHRRKDYWGPDADEFDPDRFLDERLHKYLTPNPFIFLPFNAGPRICLGQQFAYNEMSFFLVKLLQNFDSITFDSESFDPETLPPAEWSTFPGRKGKDKFWPKAHLTLYPAGGMWVKMVEAPVGGEQLQAST